MKTREAFDAGFHAGVRAAQGSISPEPTSTSFRSSLNWWWREWRGEEQPFSSPFWESVDLLWKERH